MIMGEKLKTLVIVCRDEEDSFENLLTYIKKTAGIGHSFVVHVDPEDREFSKRFTIDGDGADKIYSITATEG
jgi:hypothetical protein